MESVDCHLTQEKTNTIWTRFMDMHSGGGSKEDFEYCYIEAPPAEAKSIFYSRFGHNPERVTCSCCGQDYSIDDREGPLSAVSWYERGCEYDDKGQPIEEPRSYGSFTETYYTIDEWLASPHILVIKKEDIKPEERTVEVPRQGYVWCD